MKNSILNRRRFGTQDERIFGMQLGRHFHQAAGGQALQQRAETADGVAIVGFLWSALRLVRSETCAFSTDSVRLVQAWLRS